MKRLPRGSSKLRPAVRWAAVVLALVAIAAAPAVSPNEARTAAYFASVRNQPGLLLAFLAAMPKGGDLHNHLSGAIYAESYLRWAAQDGLCVASATLSIVSGTCDASAGRPPAADIVQNSDLYNRAIDAMSMRHWDPNRNGHDHFFATFGKMGPASGKTGDMLAEVAATCRQHGLSLVVKRHPRCGSTEVAKALADGVKANDFQLSDASIHDLISRSCAVCVVNSSVGAEALLHGKPVYVFGESEYQHICYRIRAKGEFNKRFKPDELPVSNDDLTRYLYVLRTEYSVDATNPAMARKFIHDRVVEHANH